MDYCTIDDILKAIGRDELINFTNDENRASTAIDFSNDEDSCAIITKKMISDSVDEIDPFLEPLNVLPLSEVPKIINIIAVRITIKNLYERRFRNDMPDSVISDYKIQLDKLEKIRTKKLQLGVETTDGSSSHGIVVNKTEDDRYFNSDLMMRF